VPRAIVVPSVGSNYSTLSGSTVSSNNTQSNFQHYSVPSTSARTPVSFRSPPASIHSNNTNITSIPSSLASIHSNNTNIIPIPSPLASIHSNNINLIPPPPPPTIKKVPPPPPTIKKKPPPPPPIKTVPSQPNQPIWNETSKGYFTPISEPSRPKLNFLVDLMNSNQTLKKTEPQSLKPK
jgi:hypothetical protein